MVWQYTDQDRQNMVRWESAGVPVNDQAQRLQRTYRALCEERRRMVRRGLLRIRPRAAWRSWTPDEVDQLQTLLQRGISYTRIARRLRRSRGAVVLKCRRLGTRLLTIGGVYSASDVANLLGLSCINMVSRWIKRGWLKARDAGEPPRIIWRIQLEDLWAFMENEATWMAWTPEAITDPALREWALELRAGKPRWLTVGEVARRCCVDKNTINNWIHKGYLSSVKYGNHWIREDQLDGFVIPCERPRRRAA